MRRDPRQRILIIGGSMSGLFAANLLLRRGFDVQVFERSEAELSGRGAGIIAQPQVLATLAAIGVDPSATGPFGIAIERRRTLDRAGTVVLETHLPQVATSWNRLFDVLRAAFPDERYHLGRDLAAIDQLTDGVRARFADGEIVEGSLLIGADGFRSRVRDHLASVEPLYAGYVAWRGMVDEGALSSATHRDIFPFFAFGLPPEEQILGYPVAGAGNDTRVGHRRYNFVWYRPADERTQLPALLTDESGRHHPVSIPPPLIAAPVTAEMRAHAEAVFAPQFREVVRLTAQPFLQPIYDLASPRMVEGRIVLVGDAAFVARPHVGAGTAKAADDAVALADLLEAESDIDSALSLFEAARAPVGQRIVARARHLGTYMRRDFANEAERQANARHHSPRAVMAETALMGA